MQVHKATSGRSSPSARSARDSFCSTEHRLCIPTFRGRAKIVLRKIDHAAIYVLIAASYAPFMLVSLRGPLGWTLFAAIWAMALYGMYRTWRRNDGGDPSPIPYLIMGWIESPRWCRWSTSSAWKG